MLEHKTYQTMAVAGLVQTGIRHNVDSRLTVLYQVPLCLSLKRHNPCTARCLLMVTRLAWIAHKLQSSSRCTKKSSVACRHCGSSRSSVTMSQPAAMLWVIHLLAGSVVVKRQLSALTSCKASKPSAVHLKGSGATSLVSSRTYMQTKCMC